MSNPIYALVLAGGSGERFWPLSRRARPKQLLRLVAKQTLLEQTVARLEGLVARERLLILTNVDQEAAVRELLPGLPKENILAEPAKRDTAAAVAPGGPRYRRHGRFSKNPECGGGGGGRNRRAGDDWDQTDLGLSWFRLYRTGRSSAPSEQRAGKWSASSR